MLPSITYKQAKNIKFPIYHIPDEDIEYRDGLILCRGLVVDDRNMTGDTLGKRRLQTPHDKFRLKRGYETFVSLLQSGKSTFIDSKGNVFRYQKTKFFPVKYHRIKNVERKEVASLLWVVGVEFSFLIKRPPPAGMTWAGILYFEGHPWKLYDYSSSKLPDKRRKI